MALDPTVSPQTESPAEDLTPGFFDGDIPLPEDPAAIPASDAPGSGVEVAGMFKSGVTKAFRGALRKLDDQGKFTRPGSAEGEAVPDITNGGIEPGGVPPGHNPAPAADTPVGPDGQRLPDGTQVPGDAQGRVPFGADGIDTRDIPGHPDYVPEGRVAPEVPPPAPEQPAPLSATSDPAQVGTDAAAVGRVDKEVEVRIDGPKETEVNEVYKRFTTDTPFSALDDFNSGRIETDQDALAVIASRSQVYAAEIAAETGGVIKQSVTKHLADLVGGSPGQLTKKILGGKLIQSGSPGELAANMLAARDLMVWSAQKVDTLAKLVQDGKVENLTAAGFQSMDEAIVAMQRQSALHVALQAKIKGAQTEIARTLSSFNIGVGGDALRNQNIEALIANNGGVDLARQRASMYLSLEDPAKRAVFLQKSFAARSADALYEAWINGLLSSPITHMVNLISNLLHMTGQTVVRGTAGIMARARRAKTGDNNGVRGGEGTAMMFAWKMAMKDAFRMAGAVFKDPTGEIMAKVEPGKKFRPRAFSAEGMEKAGLVGNAFDVAGSLLTLGRVSTRGLAAGDVFFKVLGQRMETYARAWRETVVEFGEGAVGVTDNFTDALAHRIANPTAATQQASIDFGQMVTFTGQLGEFGQKAQGIAANGFIRWFIPFLKTPANIISTAWEYTPMAGLSQKFRLAIAEGGEAADLAKARIALGTATMVTVGGFAQAGSITGGGPTDPKLRANLTRQGWKPYSFKIPIADGKFHYLPYKRIEPFATVIGIAADLSEIGNEAIDREQYDKIVASLAMALTKNVTSKTYMEGFSNLIDLLENPDRYGPATINNFVRTIMPRAGAMVEHMVDPELRYTRGLLDALKQDTPGWSDTLQPRVDLWGRHMMHNSVFGGVDKPNRLDDELHRLRLGIGGPSDIMPGSTGAGADTSVDIKLSPEQFYDYSVAAGKAAAENLATVIVDNPRTKRARNYKRASDEAKKIAIKNVFYNSRKAARAWLFKRSKHAPDLERLQDKIMNDRKQRLTQ